MAGPTNGIILLLNAFATGSWLDWNGGRSSLIVSGSVFPTTLSLQCLGPDSITPVTVNPNNITQNSAIALDLPAGNYRMFMSGGAPNGIYANLVSVPY